MFVRDTATGILGSKTMEKESGAATRSGGCPSGRIVNQMQYSREGSIRRPALVNERWVHWTEDVLFKRQMPGKTKFKQRRANNVGDNNPQVLAPPELGAARADGVASARHCVVRGGLPVDKIGPRPVWDKRTIVQMKEVFGDRISLQGKRDWPSSTGNPVYGR